MSAAASRFAAALPLAFLVGCGAATGVAKPLDPAAFVEAGLRIREIREAGAAPRTENVKLSLDAPYLASALAARGAVAKRPPDALRMILLGPGGTTAMDLWVVGERFQFAIPAADRIVTGDLSAPASTRRGLPVDFLRWWLLDPLGGELLAARREKGALVILLREASRTTEATLFSDGRVSAHRVTFRDGEGAEIVDEEWVDASRLDCGTVHYKDRATSLDIVATCESTRPGVSARAFEPPRTP